MSWLEVPEQQIYGPFNLSALSIDQAWLNVSSPKTLWLYELSSDCHECPYTRRAQIISGYGKLHKYAISTKFPLKYRFRSIGLEEFVPENDHSNLFCDVGPYTFGEFGIYNVFADGDVANPDCGVRTQIEPVNIYLPILLCILFYLFVIITVRIANWCYKKSRKATTFQENNNAQELLPTQQPNSSSPRARLQSLDVFRGMCIIIMIFVNDGGGDYVFMGHATWDGLYVADLVFPWFLWIMGVCIPVSISSQLKREIPVSKIFKRIAVRSAKLIGIGLILASKRGPANIEQFRLPGILQRFGICYFAAASFALFFNKSVQVDKSRIHKQLEDVMKFGVGWVVVIFAIVLPYCLLTFALPVPGCPTGYLGPGGLHKDNAYPPSCVGGAAGYIDRKIFTLRHIFKFPTAMQTYGSEPYDPEGTLGTLTSIFQVWLGVQTGLTLQVYKTISERIWRLSLWAIITGVAGAALCEAKQTGGLIPVNKNLWSLSFVLVTTSFALILLLILYIVIDVRKWWNGSPFMEPGMNSILLYVGHSVGYVMLPWHYYYAQSSNTHISRLIESLWGTTLWVILAIWLHRKKKFWSL